MDEPDTAAIRAFYAPGAGHGPLVERDIRVLTDALDAARAELRETVDWQVLAHVEQNRADAAEARIRDLAYEHQETIARARSAEARIAAALAEIDGRGDYSRVRRILAGDPT